MCMYLRAKFEVSSIILTSFRQGGGIISPPLPPQNEPLKSPSRLRKRESCINNINSTRDLKDLTERKSMYNCIHSPFAVFSA